MLKNKLVWSIDSVEARILTCSGQHVFFSSRGRARQWEAVGHWATFLGNRATEFVDPILGIRELSRIHKVQRRSPSKIAANVDLSIADLTMAWNGLDVVSTSCTGPVREQIGMGDQRDHRGWKLTMSPITRILQDGHWCSEIPFGKHTTNYGKSPFLMGKSSISMAIFNSKLLVYQRVTNLQISSVMILWLPCTFRKQIPSPKSPKSKWVGPSTPNQIVFQLYKCRIPLLHVSWGTVSIHVGCCWAWRGLNPHHSSLLDAQYHKKTRVYSTAMLVFFRSCKVVGVQSHTVYCTPTRNVHAVLFSMSILRIIDHAFEGWAMSIHSTQHVMFIGVISSSLDE